MIGLGRRASAMNLRRGFCGVASGPVFPALQHDAYTLGAAYLDPRPVANTLWMYRDACGRVHVDRGTREQVAARQCNGIAGHPGRWKPSHGTRRFQA